MLHHDSQEAQPADRGAGLGRAHADAVRGAVEVYERIFRDAVAVDSAMARDIGEEVGAQLAAGPFASIADEIEGIAHGAGLDPRRVFALNARSEILALGARSECSVVGLLPRMTANGACLLAQNWDYHPDVRPYRLLWSVRQPSGRSFVAFTEAGIVAKVGVNGDGVAVAINMLSSSADRGPVSTPVHVVLRAILQEAQSFADALALAMQTELGASLCFTLAHAAGKDEALLASVERTPATARIRWPDERGALVHTNHFLEPIEADDLIAARWPGTFARHWELTDRLRRMPPGSADEQTVRVLLGSHLGGAEGVCCHRHAVSWIDRCETLASIVMDVSARTIAVGDGTACAGPVLDARAPAGVPA